MKQVKSQEETEEERKTKCQYLNKIRANYTICCQYPVLVVWTWQYKQCMSDCSIEPKKPTRCCMVPCCHRLNGILKDIQKEDGSIAQVDVDPNGLISSFLLSVGNDTKWRPVVTNAVTRCYEQNSENQNGYDCEVIPMNLYLIIDCSYNEQFLKCPNYNPHNIKECEYTHQYIDQCS